MNNFLISSENLSMNTNIPCKIFFRKAKFETLFPNDIIKLEIVKGDSNIMLTKSFLYNINKNPKDLQGNTFQLGVIVHSDPSLMISIKLLIQRSRSTSKLLSNQKSTNLRSRRYICTVGHSSKNKLHSLLAKTGSMDQMHKPSIKKGPKDSLALNKSK